MLSLDLVKFQNVHPNFHSPKLNYFYSLFEKKKMMSNILGWHLTQMHGHPDFKKGQHFVLFRQIRWTKKRDQDLEEMQKYK